MGRKRARPPAVGRRATWENRILHGRAGMLRFTPRRTVAKTFGISYGKVEVYHPSSRFPLKRIFDFIEKVEHDPERKWLLTHPKIWTYARIRELAPTHNATVIREIILKERNAFRDANRRLVPSSQAINLIIRKNDLRPSGSPPIRVRKPVFRKNMRPLNNLSEVERNHLVESGLSVIFGKKNSRAFFDPELDDFFREKVANEARRFSFPKDLSEENRLRYFRGVVFNKMSNWLKDGLRVVGPYTRRGKQRRPVAGSPVLEQKSPAAPVAQPEEIPLDVLEKLSPREVKVVEMLLQGAKRTEIARELHLTGARVSQLVKKIREKI